MAGAQINRPEIPPNNDREADEEMQEELAFANRRGCCSWVFPCFISAHNDTVWERIASTADQEELESSTTNWTRDWLGKGLKAFKKAREWSELVAGPKWKTFIRRFNKNRGSKSGGKYHYDPMSYALNFDEGSTLKNDDDDRLFRDFSSRYASIPLTTVVKSQTDSGKDSAAWLCVLTKLPFRYRSDSVWPEPPHLVGKNLPAGTAVIWAEESIVYWWRVRVKLVISLFSLIFSNSFTLIYLFK